MRINYLLPQHSYQGQKPETYYWLECSPDEAYAFLAERCVPYFAFRNYLSFIEARHFDEIGFLVSGAGEVVDWDWSVQWQRSADFGVFKQQAVNFHPLLLSTDDLERIPRRVDLKKLKGIGIERFASQLPSTRESGFEASDDELAMAIFVYADVPSGRSSTASEMHDRGGLALELSRQFEERGNSYLTNRTDVLPKASLFFRASEMPVREIYNRRLRAQHNYENLVKRIKDEFGYSHSLIYSAIDEYDDDQLCEMLLLSFYVGKYLDHVKDFISVAMDRVPKKRN